MSDVQRRAERRAARSFDIAIKNIMRQHDVELRKLRREIIRAIKILRREILDYIVQQTGLPRGQASRRISTFKPTGFLSGSVSEFAGLAVQQRANIIHTGRIKGVKKRGNRILTIPGVMLQGPAFLLRPWTKGQKRRIYQRIGDEVVSVNHPLTIAEVFKRFEPRAKRLTDQAIARAYR